MSNRDVVTPVGRLSYPHLFERQPALNPGDEGKYGAAIIFEEGTDLSDVKAAIIAAAKEKFGDKAMDLIQKRECCKNTQLQPLSYNLLTVKSSPNSELLSSQRMLKSSLPSPQTFFI